MLYDTEVGGQCDNTIQLSEEICNLGKTYHKSIIMTVIEYIQKWQISVQHLKDAIMLYAYHTKE